MNPSINTTDNPASTFKASMRAQWDIAAPGWNAHGAEIQAWLREPTEAMCSMAGVQAGSHVIDVAAGAGDQTLAIAERVGEQGHVLATDLSPAIVALARENVMRAGFTHVETRVADGEDLGVAGCSFDAAVCRLGLMFFPDPLQGLREMYRALRPGGHVCTMVFSRPEKNPCLAILMSTALKHAGLPARDPFVAGGLLSLGRPGDTSMTFSDRPDSPTWRPWRSMPCFACPRWTTTSTSFGAPRVRSCRSSGSSTPLHRKRHGARCGNA